ncbi:MAG: EamA family transporter [Chloroflexi bacterium]|nr:EamA family transporter [Chloroflexota bacterium]
MFAWFMLIALGSIWGASYLFIKIGGAEIPPFTFVTGRALIAALALLVLLRARGESLPLNRRALKLFAVMGILNGAIPYTAITWGELSISSGLTAILVATVPLFTVIFAHWFTHDERMTPGKLIGIAIGFVGVVILFAPALQQHAQKEFFGMFAIIIASASYGGAFIVVRKFMLGFSPAAASAGQLLAGAIYMLPLSLLFDNPLALRPSFGALASLITLALFGTSVAYIIYYWLVEHTGATRASLVTYISPFTGVIWGALILSEPIEWQALVGLALIIAGIGLVNRKPAPSHALKGVTKFVEPE